MRWTAAELFEELKRYETECEASGLSQASVESYVRYGAMFLRWRTGDYRPRGASGPGRARTPVTASMEDLVADHRSYGEELRAARLQPQAVHTYLIHSDQFIRWLGGAFEPGIRLSQAVSRLRPTTKPSDVRSGLTPSGTSFGLCWCGCGGATGPRSAFIPSHDRIAEAGVIRAEYGSLVEFLRRHGYGPNPEDRHARDARSW